MTCVLMFLGHKKNTFREQFSRTMSLQLTGCLVKENYVGPTTEERLPYNPVPTGIRPGPALYAVLCISSLRPAFDFFYKKEALLAAVHL